jgi:hypothetical protein
VPTPKHALQIVTSKAQASVTVVPGEGQSVPVIRCSKILSPRKTTSRYCRAEAAMLVTFESIVPHAATFAQFIHWNRRVGTGADGVATATKLSPVEFHVRKHVREGNIESFSTAETVGFFQKIRKVYSRCNSRKISSRNTILGTDLICSRIVGHRTAIPTALLLP